MKQLHGIGKPVRRKEDGRFVTGRGQYTADITLPGQLHLAVCRSPQAHARIRSIDTSAAAAAEGVVAVLTAADLEALGIACIPCVWPLVDAAGKAMFEPPHPILAKDKASYAGEPVAAVVATSAALANDAALLIAVDYETLPAVASATAALAPAAAQVWEGCPGNLALDWELGDRAAVDAAFAAAAHVVALDTVQNRLVPNALEPRAANVAYDAARDEYTVYLASQNPHLFRYLTCRYTMPAILEHKLRVVAPDVGGGFGSKTPQYNEEYLCLAGARLTGRPVKWVGTRSEAFVSDAQARDHVTHAEMALDAA
ncbi:MAG: molybdopterin cofactor-binding domain-containing protein, partial [Gammaproteobacteria bacterium]